MNDPKIIKKAAEDIIEYLKILETAKAIGVGEFMQAAAVWNYDGIKRPFQRGITNDRK